MNLEFEGTKANDQRRDQASLQRAEVTEWKEPLIRWTAWFPSSASGERNSTEMHGDVNNEGRVIVRIIGF